MKKILLILITILILVACAKKEEKYMPVKDFMDSSKPSSYGNHQDIYVYSNIALKSDIMETLKKEFGHEVEGAQNEKDFFLLWKDFGEFEELKRAKNIIFLCDLSQMDELVSLTEQKIPAEKISFAKDKAALMLTYQNVWSDDQMITFIIGKSADNIENVILTKAQFLYLEYHKRFLHRMAKRAYYRGILKQKYFDNYPITLRIPDSYQLYKEDEINNMISFIYRYSKKDSIVPDKFITIHYEDISKDEFTRKWVIRTRDKIGKEILDNDVVDWYRSEIRPKSISSWETDVHDGYEVYGAWKNEETNNGGTFRSYVFYDDKSGRAFFIDTAVYYPAGTKIPFMLELEAIAKSYHLKEMK